MMGHEEARAALELAVAGGLSGEKDRALSAHASVCRDCASELDRLRELTLAIERLPTPMPRASVVENLRRLVHLELAGAADERLSTLVVVFLLFFSWTVTWLTLAAARLLSGGQFELMTLVSGSGGGLRWSVAYLITAWLGGGVVVVLLALGFRKSRRFA